MTERIQEIRKILGFRKKIRNRMDLYQLLVTGLQKKALVKLASFLSLPIANIAELLPISERTIRRYDPQRRFDQHVSEHIYYIAIVAMHGIEVFQNRDKFLSWLQSPNVAFGNETPFSLLSLKLGTEIVLGELGRIEHGVFS